MRNKLVSVLLVLVLIMSITACGSKSVYLNSYPEEMIASFERTKEPVTITYLTIGDKPTNGETEKVIDRLNKILIKKLNAKLDIYYIGWDDYLENYNAVLSSGDIDLDLIGTGTDWLDAWPNVQKGNFMPISEEMLRTYCPLTYRSVTVDQWRQCSYNNSVYLLPENEYSQWTNHGFIYRGDIASEAGVGEIKSWKDMTSYLAYVKESRTEMIPWDAKGDNTIITLGYLMSASNYIPIYELTTYGLWGADKSNLKKIYSPYYEGDEFIQFARLMKSWDTIGVWKDGLVTSGDNYTEFLSGVSALEEHHTQQFYTVIKPEMEVSQIGSDTKFFWFGKEKANLLKTSILHGAMAIYKNSKNPERALMVYDMIRNDEECYRLIRYGIEGKQYVINKNGMLERPSGYNPERDGIVINYWWGRRDDYEIPDSNFSWDDYYALIDDYGHAAINYPWDSVPFMTIEYGSEMEAVLEVCAEYIPKITYGQYECTPEEEVEKFRTELRQAGFEDLTTRIQAIRDEY